MISKMQANIAAVGTAVPPTRINQRLASVLVKKHYEGKLKPRSLMILEQVMAHPSIQSRYVSIDTIKEIEQLRDENLDQRMDRFTKWSVDLCESAIRSALDKANIPLGDIGALVVNTCTGYICPGISTYLIERLGLPASTRAYDLVGAGCAAALPTLQVGEGLLSTMDKGVVVCVAVEICSATYQMDDDVALLISNAIFGDGAAAVILTREKSSAALVSSASRFLPEHRDDVRFIYRNGRLHNRLSPKLADITGKAAASFVNDFLSGSGLLLADIHHWAIHPGGDKILNAVQENLGLTDSAMTVSRSILRKYGNMSSPTVLFELDQILSNHFKPDERCLMLAFGAGMAIHGVMLTGRPA